MTVTVLPKVEDLQTLCIAQDDDRLAHCITQFVVDTFLSLL